MKHNYPAKRSSIQNRSELNLTIINTIKETGGLPKKLMSKSLLSLYTSRLTCEGFIRKVGYGVWEVLKPYSKQVQVNSETPRVTPHHPPLLTLKSDDSRVHNLMFKLKVEAPLSWEARLNARGLAFEGSGGYIRLVFDGFKVWLCRSSVIIYFPSGIDFRASSVPVSLRLAVNGLFSFVPRLEAYLGFTLRYNGLLVWSMSRKHIGLMKNSLAQLYAKEGKKLKVFDDRGLWLVADDSFNLNELEAVRTPTNQTEAEIIQGFFNDLKKNPVKPSEFMSMLTGLLLAVNGVKEAVKSLNDRVDRL